MTGATRFHRLAGAIRYHSPGHLALLQESLYPVVADAEAYVVSVPLDAT